MLNAIFEEAGHTTALLNSIRIKIGDRSEPNLLRMSMPGRFFIQRFLRSSSDKKCSVAILEMTSEGAKQYRHRSIALNALIFTNLAPEHIESHGSYESYANAKFEIGRQLARSRKQTRIIVANADDEESTRYLRLPVEQSVPYSLAAHSPWFADEHGGYFTLDDSKISVHLPGEFSLKNALAASMLAKTFGIETRTIARALEKLKLIPGRAERIEAGQDFIVVVDYAHTPDSLEAIYQAYRPSPSLGVKRRSICDLSATGGGRDTWKRSIMGSIADSRCDHVILTNEDPYDENPDSIVKALTEGMKRTPEILMDRRAAIRRVLELAKKGDAVLITGKGTDPCICGPNGSKVPWSDADVAREELGTLTRTQRV